MSTSPRVVAPADIDGSFVPVVPSSVAAVSVDGEVIVLDRVTGTLRNLDRIAGLVWGCVDGSGTIDEIASDLSAEFGVEPGRARHDVIALMRTLGRDGLLEGVASVGNNLDEQSLGTPATQSDAQGPRFLEEPPSS